MPRPKTVAIAGSSGGNLFRSGGGDPARLLQEIAAQCVAAGIEVIAAQFVAAGGSMDSHGGGAVAAGLYEWDAAARAFGLTAEGSLEAVNRLAEDRDRALATRIEAGEIDGLILISCDPQGANRLAVEAAVRRGLPIAGTGGTSMGLVKALGANVVSMSGTTGTTNLTRAVGFALALSRHWRLPYRMAGARRWRDARIGGVLASSLPAFLAALLLLSLAKLPWLSGLDEAAGLLSALPPVILAVLAARHMGDLGESTLIAGAIAGLLAAPGGIVGAVLAGLAAGWLVPRLFQWCTVRGFPATAVSVAAAGAAGLAPGLAVLYAAAPLTSAAGDAVRDALAWTLDVSPPLVGLAFGLAMWPLILRGWYHATVLPLILLEMERYGNSLFGALDMAGLVMASAGILLAQLAVPLRSGDREQARKPFWLNVGFGTFIEASYVYMRQSRLVYAGAVLASGAAGAVIGALGLRSTAYVPFYAALLFSNDAWGFLAAMLTALLVAFAAGACANWAGRRKRPAERTESSKE